MDIASPWFVVLTLVSLNGQVVTTEHYAQPYATMKGCIFMANLKAGEREVTPVCVDKRPDKACVQPEAMNMWVASCTQEELKGP